MAKGSVTKRAIDALHSQSGPAFLWDRDLKGFGVKATASGCKNYVYQYRLGGRGSRTRRLTIGSHGSITPDQARRIAQALAHDIACGFDPASVKQDRARQRIHLAFDTYADKFMDEFVSVSWRPFRASAKSILSLHVTPVLGRTALPDITASDVTRVLERIPIDKRALRRNTFTLLRRLFNWARRRGDLSVSPLQDFEAPPAVPSRDRVLSDDELRLVWEAAATMGFPFGPVFQLLIATGQRREEVTALDWSELCREANTWTLPATRSKNRVANVIPLNSLAVTVLDQVAALDRASTGWPRAGLIFTTTGRTPVSGHSRAKVRLDETIAQTVREAQVERSAEPQLRSAVPWRIHDLRRTVATGLQRLGVRFEVTEALLNHVSGARSGVAGVYQRHGWTTEKRAALDAWSRHVEHLALEDRSRNVVELPRVAA